MNNSIVFATAGKSDSYAGKFPQDLPRHLEQHQLNGFEVQFGRGVRLSQESGTLLPEYVKKYGINLSVHAPYFISLSGINEETRLKSVGYIVESAAAAKKIGAKRVVVHSGSCAKLPREEAMELAKDTLKAALSKLDESGLGDITLCVETMGKINQLGTLEEVVELCKSGERLIPCIDFGHLNARSLGGISGREEYAKAFDLVERELSAEILQNIHIHFSKIEYTNGGEKKHLTFTDRQFGPEYRPMLDEIIARKLTPFIVCESEGTQAEDAETMSRYYKERVEP